MSNIIAVLKRSLFIICLVIPVHGASGTGALSGKTDGLVQKMHLFEDRSGSMTVQDVASPVNRGKFTAYDTIPNFGFTESVIWVRVTVSNSSLRDTEKILEVLYPALNMVEVYIPDGQSAYIKKRSGSRVPFVERDIRHRNSIFSIPVRAGRINDVYVRISSSSALNFKLNLYDATGFMQKDYLEQLLAGMLYGILMIMLLYNLFLYFTVRDKSYLFYVCYTLSNILFSLSVHGLAYEYLWPGAGEWAIRSHPFFTATTLLCAVMFSLDFLRIKKYSLLLYRIFLVLSVFIIFSIAGSLFMPYRYCIAVNVFLSYTVFPLVIITGIYILRCGYRPAGYYLTAWSFLIAGSLVYALSNSGIIPRNLLTEYSVQIGTVFEVSLFALALGGRINVLRKEKEDYARYRELDRVKSEFIANISHEIRTPLTLMLTPVWGVIDGSHKSVADIEFFKMLDRNGSRLLSLINDLLDFSKLDSGKMTMNVVHGDLLKLAREHAAAVSSACELRNIGVEVSGGSDTVMMYFDPEKMDSVLANLFSNAMAFTGDGGLISVQVNAVAGNVLVEFSDNGCGIPAEKIDTIFDRFTQADSGTARRFGGTGIGLALVKEFLGLHNGYISVASRCIDEHPDDHGTIFRIVLPAGKSHLENRKDVTFCDKRTGHVPRHLDISSITDTPGIGVPVSRVDTARADDRPLVMVVDDNTDMHTLLNELLAPSYRLINAFNGKAAFELLGSMDDLPDLIISDVMMPEMDGYALTRIIRSNADYEGIPLILLTAKAETSMKIEGLESGATDYMAKPFSGRELLARVKAQLGMKQLRDKLARSNNQLYSRLTESGKACENSPNSEVEEKIRIVTGFIRENYSADISREGLAAAVNMSADYLSRMFNRVTGKRLDEYINELRAADAAVRLEKTDETIISIAMMTGFESLRHFNRVFIRFYNINPSEYRRIKK